MPPIDPVSAAAVFAAELAAVAALAELAADVPTITLAVEPDDAVELAAVAEPACEVDPPALPRFWTVTTN